MGDRRPSSIASAADVRNREKRRRREQEKRDRPAVSVDAVLGIIDRECEKAGRRWYGVPGTGTQTLATEVAAEASARAASRKEARQIVLAALERFPVRP